MPQRNISPFAPGFYFQRDALQGVQPWDPSPPNSGGGWLDPFYVPADVQWSRIVAQNALNDTRNYSNEAMTYTDPLYNPGIVGVGDTFMLNAPWMDDWLRQVQERRTAQGDMQIRSDLSDGPRAPDNYLEQLQRYYAEVDRHGPHGETLVQNPSTGQWYVRDQVMPEQSSLSDALGGALFSGGLGLVGGGGDLLANLFGGNSNAVAGGAGLASGLAGGGGGTGGGDGWSLAEEIASLLGGGAGAAGAGGAATGALGGALENLGNVTGGGIFGSNVTAGQLAAALGLPPSAANWLSQGASSLGLNGGSGSLLGNVSGLRTLGSLASTAIGAFGASQQASAQRDLANRYMQMGAPYRQGLAALTLNPSSFLASDRVRVPVQMGTDAVARSLSTTGNPANNGRTLQELQNYATNSLYGQLTNRENQLAGFGGLANFNAAAPTAANNAIASTGNIYNAIGAGINQITNPTPSFEQMAQVFGLGFGSPTNRLNNQGLA